MILHSKKISKHLFILILKYVFCVNRVKLEIGECDLIKCFRLNYFFVLRQSKDGSKIKLERINKFLLQPGLLERRPVFVILRIDHH